MIRENSRQFLRHTTKTWTALTIEILITAVLFMFLNLIGVSGNLSVLLTFIAAVIFVTLGVRTVYQDESKPRSVLVPTNTSVEKLVKQPDSDQKPSVQPDSDQKPSVQPDSDQKPSVQPRLNDYIKHLHSEHLLFTKSPSLDPQVVANFSLKTTGENADQPLFKAFVQNLIRQSYIEQTCALHLTWHRTLRDSTWDRIQPILPGFVADSAKQGWLLLFGDCLDERLQIEQQWLQPLAWSLVQQSQIKQDFVQKLLDSPSTKHWIAFFIQSLAEESKLEKSCAMQIKWNLASQEKSEQIWSASLRQGLAVKSHHSPEKLKILFQQLDERMQSEQKAANLLKQGLDIQMENEQLWISMLIKYLSAQNQFSTEQVKMPIWVPTGQHWIETVVKAYAEQTKAEGRWIEGFRKHTQEDKRVEQRFEEAFSSQAEEQTETVTSPESLPWQDFVSLVEQRLEKHAQIEREIAEKLTESLEKGSQAKQEAADLLAGTLKD